MGIHRCYGSQESRFSSDRVSPRARVLIGGTAALRMRGLVATTGARSKHMIMGGLEPAGALVSLALFVVGAAMTTLYSAKLLRSLGGYRVRVSSRWMRHTYTNVIFFFLFCIIFSGGWFVGVSSDKESPVAGSELGRGFVEIRRLRT